MTINLQEFRRLIGQDRYLDEERLLSEDAEMLWISATKNNGQVEISAQNPRASSILGDITAKAAEIIKSAPLHDGLTIKLSVIARDLRAIASTDWYLLAESNDPDALKYLDKALTPLLKKAAKSYKGSVGKPAVYDNNPQTLIWHLATLTLDMIQKAFANQAQKAFGK
jgi:hypothetical protein